MYAKKYKKYRKYAIFSTIFQGLYVKILEHNFIIPGEDENITYGGYINGKNN